MRVLFLTHRLPYAPNRGDRVRAFHLLRHVSAGAEVHVLSLAHDADEASHADDVRKMVASVSVVRVTPVRNLWRSVMALPTRQPLTHTMLDGRGLPAAIDRIVRDHPPDVVLAFCTGVAWVALEPPLRSVPLVLDMVDVDSAKWAALSSLTAVPRSWIYAREARALARFERDAARHAFATLLTTEPERATLRELAPGARIEVIQNGVDVNGLRPSSGPAETSTIVFCGVMNYAPNEQAAEWIAREVWPLVRRARPDARLSIVGSHPTRRVRRLASSTSGIIVTGHVADVRPFLWGAAAAAAPLRTARGVQNKVLEAVSAGLPTVVTPVVRNGLPAEVLPACVTAEDARSFADAIVTLLSESPGQRRARAERADLSSISWQRRLEPLSGLLAAATRQR